MTDAARARCWSESNEPAAEALLEREVRGEASRASPGAERGVVAVSEGTAARAALSVADDAFGAGAGSTVGSKAAAARAVGAPGLALSRSLAACSSALIRRLMAPP